MCDRDPVPQWSFGRVTLLGDAAHPMHPLGSNGASQPILDARSVAPLLAGTKDVAAALRAYEATRLPATTRIVIDNRSGGPERVIDLVEDRAPAGFIDLDRVASHAELEASSRPRSCSCPASVPHRCCGRLASTSLWTAPTRAVPDDPARAAGGAPMPYRRVLQDPPGAGPPQCPDPDRAILDAATRTRQVPPGRAGARHDVRRPDLQRSQDQKRHRRSGHRRCRIAAPSQGSAGTEDTSPQPGRRPRQPAAVGVV
jgi:hypothetical protein